MSHRNNFFKLVKSSSFSDGKTVLEKKRRFRKKDKRLIGGRSLEDENRFEENQAHSTFLEPNL